MKVVLLIGCLFVALLMGCNEDPTAEFTAPAVTDLTIVSMTVSYGISGGNAFDTEYAPFYYFYVKGDDGELKLRYCYALNDGASIRASDSGRVFVRVHWKGGSDPKLRQLFVNSSDILFGGCRDERGKGVVEKVEFFLPPENLPAKIDVNVNGQQPNETLVATS